ncbi:prokaryotic molybdopterin-containing oxidoreductase family, membrane subunit [Desulfonatronum zhilinae]|nr:prokaryotic molybdopterin-containing oxidoreductase family, membrane subunit [Desulfonatronum zhilinae]
MPNTETRPRKSALIYLLLFACLALLALGVFSAVQIQLKGQEVFGSTDQVPWNVIIAGYVFLALAASGLCLTANFFELLNIKRFQLLQKRAHFLAVSFLVPALAMLAMDLGQFSRMHHFILYPSLSSPLWWMGTVYGVYLVLLLSEFWAIHKGYARMAYIFSVITLIAAVVATSILGGIFSVILDRTLWFGSGTPVWFVFSAVISGIAAMIFMTILTYSLNGKSMGDDLQQALRELGTILTVLLGIGLVFTVWRLIASVYVKVPDAFFIISSPYGLQFWVLFLGVGILAPFLLLLTRTKRKSSAIELAGLLVLIGMYVDKHIFVLAGQLRQSIDGTIAAYASTPAEWGLMLGTVAAAVLMYMFGERYLSLDQAPRHAEATMPRPAPVSRDEPDAPSLPLAEENAVRG